VPASVWKGRLSFGLVSIPVRLFKAARRERIRFHRVYRPADISIPEEPPSEAIEEAEPAPAPKHNVEPIPRPPIPVPAEPEEVARVRNLPVAELTEKPVAPPQILKGYEIEKDQYVTFEPQEVAALRPQTSSELEIAEFVRIEEIDPIFFDTSYYVAPDREGEKPYALLFRALAETGYVALSSLAMHGREHATVIRPGRRGLILHTLFYAGEVRAAEEYGSDPNVVTTKELELAKLLVRALAAKFDPEKLKDTFEERLQELIRARSEQAFAAYEHGEVTTRAPVVDILEALRKSLEIARKPVQSQKSESKTSRTRARRSRS
jgi:DNA end-binding protein Ku